MGSGQSQPASGAQNQYPDPEGFIPPERCITLMGQYSEEYEGMWKAVQRSQGEIHEQTLGQHFFVTSPLIKKLFLCCYVITFDDFQVDPNLDFAEPERIRCIIFDGVHYAPEKKNQVAEMILKDIGTPNSYDEKGAKIALAWIALVELRASGLAETVLTAPDRAWNLQNAPQFQTHLISAEANGDLIVELWTIESRSRRCIFRRRRWIISSDRREIKLLPGFCKFETDRQREKIIATLTDER